ncbi:hypothetical protein PENSUB_1341 [Penicillium subrubescens]|uniref:Endonuclease/exonuclease/phosphatase domain-containing protein n=1 Tax=Penicillium subrubescens TaxID=1316194 RepID=A0A1Q5UKH6_9EURO|nr:hypothetical protein PENSUB_1341 [Penicillium subrubescens]
METAGLDNWLTPGTIIRDQSGSQSTIDLVLALYALREQIVAYEVDYSVHADSDHLLILTLLEINVLEAADPVKRRNWKAIDVDLLRQVFFPSPPVADLSDIDPTSPPNQLTFPAISQQEIIDAIKRAPPDKAPGEDGIPNRAWKMLADNKHKSVAILIAIFDACMRTGYNLRHFQASITVTLRKGGPRGFR